MLTVGAGRDIDDRGISREEALYLGERHHHDALRAAGRATAGSMHVNDVRQRFVADMAFNLGIVRFTGFRMAFAGNRRRRLPLGC
jgi:lysozyme